MLCPACGAPNTRVIDSRPADGGTSIRRRRRCETCSTRFTTYERLESQLMVVKRSGKVEPFSSAKLAVGLGSALADRPVSGAVVEDLARDIEKSARESGGNSVSSEEIGREVLDRLRELDEVAYLRFASVYKEFQDAADFEREVAALESAE